MKKLILKIVLLAIIFLVVYPIVAGLTAGAFIGLGFPHSIIAMKAVIFVIILTLSMSVITFIK